MHMIIISGLWEKEKNHKSDCISDMVNCWKRDLLLYIYFLSSCQCFKLVCLISFKTNGFVFICLSFTQSIGMLSYTFLRGTGKEDIVVPMVRTVVTILACACVYTDFYDELFTGKVYLPKWQKRRNKGEFEQQYVILELNIKFSKNLRTNTRLEKWKLT